ncbi:MAG: single-stranded-DNA-specific exonuclease RecJ, partial [Pseudomonadota bacterium]
MLQKIIRRRSISPDQGLEGADLHPLLTRVYRARGVVADQLDLGLEHLIPPEGLLASDKAAGILA